MYSRKFTLISWLYIIAQYGTLCELVFSRASFTNILTDWVPRAFSDLCRIISAWSFGDALSYKLARPSASGADTSLEIALSPILLGRFLFQLRKAAEMTDNLAHSNRSLQSHQLTSFCAAENLNLGNATTINHSTDLPLAIASDDEFNNPPDNIRSSVNIPGGEDSVV
ncbi:hypothetical protein Clacol_010153 [Clathrus columnatus]|uniref:Very-long-chain (3R)-3-hydroxyacyl-CoA dehydratase n=1 Tax=Clathrus columnatus TaxID=1419009 RepID=A0AAV5AT07_9AGAM|nr:hypothetical protein Clacol_010153 [Clathrus columnatus]